MNDTELNLQMAASYLGMTGSGLDYYNRTGRGPERDIIEIPGRQKQYRYKKVDLDEWRKRNPTAGFQRNQNRKTPIPKNHSVQVQSLPDETKEQLENKIAYLEQELERALDEAVVLQRIIMILGKEIK